MMLYKKVRRPKLKVKHLAKDVLYDKMMFYHTKAETIANGLMNVIKSGVVARADLLVALHKDMHKFNSIVIECASKLAPYQSPKLETVEVRNTNTVRFVVEAPRPINDTKKWLESTKQLPPPIDITPDLAKTIEEVN
jgi:hypothetical protein